VVDSELLDVD